MLTQNWKTEKFAEGKYNVRMSLDGRLPGDIVGGNGHWQIDKPGVSLSTVYKTKKAAAEQLVRWYYGI